MRPQRGRDHAPLSPTSAMWGYPDATATRSGITRPPYPSPLRCGLPVYNRCAVGDHETLVPHICDVGLTGWDRYAVEKRIAVLRVEQPLPEIPKTEPAVTSSAT